MLKKHNIIKKNELQIEVYEDLIVAAEIAQRLMIDKEGKQANKRIADYLTSEITAKFPNISVYLSKNKYNDKMEIELYHQNRSFNSIDEHTVYIDDNTLVFAISSDDKIIDLDMTNKEIKQRTSYIESSIATIRYTNENIDNIKSEYDKINEMIKKYKSDYDYSTLNDMLVEKFR